MGGFQGAEGHDSGAEWFVENQEEELDAPNEFFYDRESSQLGCSIQGGSRLLMILKIQIIRVF